MGEDAAGVEDEAAGARMEASAVRGRVGDGDRLRRAASGNPLCLISRRAFSSGGGYP